MTPSEINAMDGFNIVRVENQYKPSEYNNPLTTYTGFTDISNWELWREKGLHTFMDKKQHQ